MHEVEASAVKNHLPSLLANVSHGESFAITDHGHIIALLIPPKKSKHTTEEAIKGILALRDRVAMRRTKVSLKEINEWKEEGRK